MAGFIYIPVEELHPHPDNPRKDLGDLTELAASIRENGIFQNLTVVPNDDESGYTVIIGHRRLEASKLAGLDAVPCVVEQMSKREQIETMLMENMQRADLTVYEQAQSFQLMLDMGSDVGTIINRTGFSEKTVRRRLKMAELDKEKLKEASYRQLTLGDFDELAKIEDVKVRNELLDFIGTRDFDYKISAAFKKQQCAKTIPIVKKWLKSIGAKAINSSERWSSKYDSITNYIQLVAWGEPGNTPPEKLPSQVYYYLSDTDLQLYKEAERKKPERKSPEELEKTRRINEYWDKLEAAAETSYDLRRKFIEDFHVSQKSKCEVLRGAMFAAALEALCYNGPDRNALSKMFGIDTSSYDKDRGEKTLNGCRNMQDKDLAAFVYALFGDSKKVICCETSYRGTYPKYKLDYKLTVIYDWLASLGYVMSTEETKLLNGEHELFRGE